MAIRHSQVDGQCSDNAVEARIVFQLHKETLSSAVMVKQSRALLREILYLDDDKITW